VSLTLWMIMLHALNVIRYAVIISYMCSTVLRMLRVAYLVRTFAFSLGLQ